MSTIAEAAAVAAAVERELGHYAQGQRSLAWRRGPRTGLANHRRFAAFLNWESGLLAGEGGGILHMGPRAPLAHILLGLSSIPASSRPRNIFLTGPDRAAHRPSEEWYNAVIAEGWRIDRWYHSEDHRDHHDCEVARGEGDAAERYSIRMAAEWFGDERDPRKCAAAHYVMRGELCKTFGDYAYVYPNPTQTGLYLHQLSLPAGMSYPVLPDGFRRLLQSNSSQGRVELLTPKGLTELPRLQCLDGRWMYASCVRHLPTGAATYDAIGEYAEHIPGVYQITATVPKGWKHVGLLPCLDASGETVYPSKPGQSFTGWVSGAELELALNPGEGFTPWPVQIQRRLLWWERSTDPARGWLDKLKTLRSAAEARGDACCAAAYRNLLLRPIGAWHSRGPIEEGVVGFDQADQIPAGAKMDPREDGIHWTVRREQVRPHTHPEWSATAWGRARARLARAALKLPRESLIALRTDGIWTTHDTSGDPTWVDTGKPGAWRVKEHRETPMPAPHETTALLELISAIRAEEK